MQRAIIKFADGGYCNLTADYMDIDENWVSVYANEKIVGIFKLEDISAAYISEKCNDLKK